MSMTFPDPRGSNATNLSEMLEAVDNPEVFDVWLLEDRAYTLEDEHGNEFGGESSYAWYQYRDWDNAQTFTSSADWVKYWMNLESCVLSACGTARVVQHES